MTDRSYQDIVAHYERCLEEHGEGPRAVDWKNERDAKLRYDIMLDVVRQKSGSVSLLDFGCGLAGLADHIAATGWSSVLYSGLDISEKFVEAARKSHPGLNFYCADLMREDAAIPEFDYVVMNGIFTRSETLSEGEMFDYLRRLLPAVWRFARRGLAFNVMSEFVDWKSEHLFHPAIADVAGFVTSDLSRHFRLRSDYGLFETTWYVYRNASVEVTQ